MHTSENFLILGWLWLLDLLVLSPKLIAQSGDKLYRTVRITAVDQEGNTIPGVSVRLSSREDTTVGQSQAVPTDQRGNASLRLRLKSDTAYRVEFTNPKPDTLDDPKTRSLIFQKGEISKSDTLVFPFKVYAITLHVIQSGDPSALVKNLGYEAFWLQTSSGKSIEPRRADFINLGNGDYQLTNLRRRLGEKLKVYAQILGWRGEAAVTLTDKTFCALDLKPVPVTYELSLTDIKTPEAGATVTTEITVFRLEPGANRYHLIPPEAKRKDSIPLVFAAAYGDYVTINCRHEAYLPRPTLVLQGGELISRKVLDLADVKMIAGLSLAKDSAGKEDYEAEKNKKRFGFEHEAIRQGKNTGVKIKAWLIPKTQIQFMVCDSAGKQLSDFEIASAMKGLNGKLASGKWATCDVDERTTLAFTLRKSGYSEYRVEEKVNPGDCKVLTVILRRPQSLHIFSDCLSSPPAQPDTERTPPNPQLRTISLTIRVVDTLDRPIKDKSLYVRLIIAGNKTAMQSVNEAGETAFSIEETYLKPSASVNIEIIKNGRKWNIVTPGNLPIPFERFVQRTAENYFLLVKAFDIR